MRGSTTAGAGPDRGMPLPTPEAVPIRGRGAGDGSGVAAGSAGVEALGGTATGSAAHKAAMPTNAMNASGTRHLFMIPISFAREEWGERDFAVRGPTEPSLPQRILRPFIGPAGA